MATSYIHLSNTIYTEEKFTYNTIKIKKNIKTYKENHTLKLSFGQVYNLYNAFLKLGRVVQF